MNNEKLEKVLFSNLDILFEKLEQLNAKELELNSNLNEKRGESKK